MGMGMGNGDKARAVARTQLQPRYIGGGALILHLERRKGHDGLAFGQTNSSTLCIWATLRVCSSVNSPAAMNLGMR